MTSDRSIPVPFRRALGAAALLALAWSTTASAATPPSWVARSNENAQVVLEVMARFGPEGAGELGIPGLDEEIFDLKPGFEERGKGRHADHARQLDAALVSLDLVVLHARRGDTARNRQLAAEMLPIFEAGGVHPDALAALLLFQQAAEAEEVTVDLVGQVAASVRRAHGRV